MPQPVQLFTLDEDNKVTLNQDALKFFKNNRIKDKKVCVISIAGAFRQGKSFLLNFFLRYLNNLNDKNWIRANPEISGFSWKRGSQRETSGILMWSEFFLTKLPNGEEIAVILLDTQGTFDHETTMTQCTSMFALSVLISSVQIYNVKNKIDASHLNYLQLFAGYGKMISEKKSENSGVKPFQTLLFLVRDWCYKFECSYGFGGGQKMLGEVFKKHHDSGQNELISVQESIKENFDDVRCFLLPHPGTAATSQKDFLGDIELLEDDFVEFVEKLVGDLLSPEKLVPKTFNNEDITVEELSQLIEAFSENFKTGQQVAVTDMHQAFNDTLYAKMVDELIAEYSNIMKTCKSKEDAANLKTQILNKFKKKKKLGDKKLEEKHTKQLSDKIDDLYDSNFKAIVDPNVHQKLKLVVQICSEKFSDLLIVVTTASVVVASKIFTKPVVRRFVKRIFKLNRKYVTFVSKPVENILKHVLDTVLSTGIHKISSLIRTPAIGNTSKTEEVKSEASNTNSSNQVFIQEFGGSNSEEHPELRERRRIKASNRTRDADEETVGKLKIHKEEDTCVNNNNNNNSLALLSIVLLALVFAFWWFMKVSLFI